jgi:hypothetical protein
MEEKPGILVPDRPGFDVQVSHSVAKEMPEEMEGGIPCLIEMLDPFLQTCSLPFLPLRDQIYF